MEAVVYADDVCDFWIFSDPVVSMVLLLLLTLGCYFLSPSLAGGEPVVDGALHWY